jgi:TolA-binding protein
MKNSIFVAIFATFVPFTILSAEPSAFGAGNLDSPHPYGLTSTEKVLLENKTNLQKVVVKSNHQDNKVDSIRERIDGLQTIIEGLSRKTHENDVALKELNKLNATKAAEATEYEQRLSLVGQTNSQSIIKINSVIVELSALIDSINSAYITKDEFNDLVNNVNDFKVLVSKELKMKSSSSENALDKMKKNEIASDAKNLFDKKFYTKSIKYYNYLIEHRYKPAFAHYMIGEMNYRRNNYANAISYFKKSVSLYSKASYMPLLMLHTAISMEKTGDKTNAISFYKAVVAKYPDSQSSKEAKKYLSLIN